MISEKILEQVLHTSLKGGGDWSDIFLEDTSKNIIGLTDKKIQNVSQQGTTGAGIRVIKDHREYYAYTNDLTEAGLVKAARAVADAVGSGQAGVAISLETKRTHITPLKKQVGWDKKIELVRRADQICRGVSDLIAQVNINYMDEIQKVVIANSEGLFREDVRQRGRFTIAPIASDGNDKQASQESPGAHRGFDFFESLDLETLCNQAAQRALMMLNAGYSPQGQMPVIIDNGFGGVILHEACGHSLEASAIARKASVFAEKMGNSIASTLVSVVDDATLADEWGTCALDDEGTPTQRNLLIEKGILKSYLVDRVNGERLGIKSTGSARRESYRYSPTSRMNNTFILPGCHTLGGMIAETPYGLYARKLGGGSVNPVTGEFNFSVTEGYVIRDGKIAEPVRGAVLIGRGDEVLQRIDRVGSELELAQGMCGAASGWVPVNVGQPPVRVSKILVGGRS